MVTKMAVATRVSHSKMSRPKGRPKRSDRDDVTVKIDRTVKGKAEKVATHLGKPLAEVLSEMLRAPVDRAYLRMLRDLEEKG